MLLNSKTAIIILIFIALLIAIISFIFLRKNSNENILFDLFLSAFISISVYCLTYWSVIHWFKISTTHVWIVDNKNADILRKYILFGEYEYILNGKKIIIEASNKKIFLIVNDTPDTLTIYGKLKNRTKDIDVNNVQLIKPFSIYYSDNLIGLYRGESIEKSGNKLINFIEAYAEAMEKLRSTYFLYLDISDFNNISNSNQNADEKNNNNDITMYKAWQLWFIGKQISDLKWFGIKIFYWGRIGKILQLIAGLTIIAEIIGPERLRIFGQKLHHAFLLKDVWKLTASTFKDLFFYFRSFFLINDNEFSEKYYKSKSGKITLLFCWIICSYCLIENYWIDGFLLSLAQVATAFFFASIIIPLFTFTLRIFYYLPMIFIDFFILEPIAWLLERESLNHIIKITSLFLLFTGFYFDFLAS